MKNLYTIILSGVLAGVTLTACDSVSEEDRLIPAEIIPRRSILIEEFTGQACTNCPDGHAKLKEIQATLGDSVVPVGIHASLLATNPPIGYKTETGERYYKEAGTPDLPTAVFDKQTDPLRIQAWGATVNRLIIQPTPFTVVAEGTVSDDASEYSIDVHFSSGEDYEGKLMVWICENDLVGRQLDHGVNIPDYVHQHVFRAAVTEDIWGDPVTLKAHEAQHKSYTRKLTGERWKPANIYVVAFLYNDAGVAQVTSSHRN